MKAHYTLEASSLVDLTKVTVELSYLMGIEPLAVELDDGTRLAYCHTDARKVRDGRMTAEEYARKHVLSSTEK